LRTEATIELYKLNWIKLKPPSGEAKPEVGITKSPRPHARAIPSAHKNWRNLRNVGSNAQICYTEKSLNSKLSVQNIQQNNSEQGRTSTLNFKKKFPKNFQISKMPKSLAC